MKQLNIHPISFALGALFLGLATSVQSVGSLQRILTLSTEEKEILSHMSLVMLDDAQGGQVKTLRIEGVNVQIVNGLGATNGEPANPDSIDGMVTETNGLGNLIVGYNELGNPVGDNRTGSHNVIVGHGQNYTSFGGVVAARDNTVSGPYACVTGGIGNRAIAAHASVSGGRNGLASGMEASITGGLAAVASGLQSSVNGGAACSALGDNASVNGGNQNQAMGRYAAVNGGEQNRADGQASAVGGGQDNMATANYAYVGGGELNVAMGNHSSVCAGRSNLAEGFWSAVSGGQSNTAGPANQNFATVGGGMSRSTSNSHDWAAGSLLEDL